MKEVFKGSTPGRVAAFTNPVSEFMFYQDMLVHKAPAGAQLSSRCRPRLPTRLKGLTGIIRQCWDYNENELDNSPRTYTYLSVKRLPIGPGNSFSRPGWHIDGFLSEDVTFIYSDIFPTLYSTSDFSLTRDHAISMAEMAVQAKETDVVEMPANELVHIDLHCVHRVNVPPVAHTRTFLKVVLSHRPFNLEGNAVNPECLPPWSFVPRAVSRNGDSRNDPSK